MPLCVCHNCYCHCHCRIAFRLLLLGCSGCTWREECVGNALDRGRVNIVDDARGPLPVRVSLLCCLGVMISIAIAIVGSRLGCSCCCYSGCAWREGRVCNYLDSRRVDIVDVDNGLLRSETNKRALDFSCNRSNRSKYKIDRYILFNRCCSRPQPSWCYCCC